MTIKIYAKNGCKQVLHCSEKVLYKTNKSGDLIRKSPDELNTLAKQIGQDIYGNHYLNSSFSIN
jgi:hypothetical protein